MCHRAASQLGAFDAVVKQMLEDVQERLVYRTHIYIQTDITGYKPAPGDLAYPDKLEMMEASVQRRDFSPQRHIMKLQLRLMSIFRFY